MSPHETRRAPVVTAVCPVLETPFTDDGSVDELGFSRVVDHVIAAGVGSVMFPGFASEFHKLADDERRRLITLLLERTNPRPDVRAVISVPDHATDLAVRSAQWAVEQGADALNLLPPYFLGPSPIDVRAHVLAVLAAVDPVPVILQYAPAQTGTALNAESIAQLASEASNLVQVKVEATPPGTLISALSAACPELTSVVGYGGVQLPDALRRGAVGVQPGCSFVSLYQRVWSDWTSGARDDALALHTRMLPYVSYWMQNVELIIASEKLISFRLGLISSAHCRRPGYTLDREEVATVDRFLAEFTDLL